MARHINTRVPLQEAGFGKFLLLISPFAIGGGVIAYAKYDKEFRQTLVKNVPGIEPVLEVFIDDVNPFADIQKKLGEYRKKIDETSTSISSTVSSATSSVTGLFGGGSKDESKYFKSPANPFLSVTLFLEVEPPKAVSAKLPPVTRSTAAPQEQKAAATVASSVPAPPISKPESKAAPKSAPAPVVAAPAKPEKPVIPKDLAELERAVENAATQAVKEYNKAVLILKSYNDDVKKIVDSAVENIDVNAWTALKNKTLTRDTAVEAAEQAALAARKKLNELEQQVDKNVVEISGDVKTALKHSISSFNDHLNAAKVEVLKAKELAGTSENYWKKVESARGYFVKEIESLFGVNLNEKKLNLSKDDIDLFLVNAYSHVMAYQKELQKIQTEGELRLRRALDAVRGSDQTESVKAQLEYELEKERRNLNLQNQTKVRHCTII